MRYEYQRAIVSQFSAAARKCRQVCGAPLPPQEFHALPGGTGYSAFVRQRRWARAIAIAIATAATAATARGARAQAPIEVSVRGSTAGGFAARASTDSAPREPIDAASMLDELPAVHIRRLGAEGAFATISVRGSAPSQVAVVLGGIPLTSAADPAFDVGALPLWPGASFRVYRGFAPATLGTTGYLGGVLSIDPPSPAIGQRTEWWAAAGSFGGLKLRVGDLRREGHVSLGSGFYASRSDGNFPYFVQVPLGSGPVVEARRGNAGQAVVGGIERVSIERPWGSVSALLLADARRLGVPGAVVGSTPNRFVTLSTTRLVAGLEATVRTTTTSALRLSGWSRRESSDLADPAAELDRTHASTTRSATIAAGFAAIFRARPVDQLSLGVVLDGRVERFAPRSIEGRLPTTPATRLAAGLGVDLDYRPLDRLTMHASARADARRDDARGAITTTGDDAGVSGALIPTGHAGASYRFHDAAILSAHLGALARPPSFPELYGNGASLLASPGLRTERAFSFDAGLAGDVGDGRLAAGYELVGFASLARDLIVFQPFGRATFRASNVARALIGGGEISAHVVARGLRVQATYTLLLTQNQDDGRPLPGRPRHDLAYDAAYKLGPVRIRYGVDLVSGVLVDGQIPLAPRIFHGTGVAIDLPWVRGLRAAIDVANLFDQRIQYVPSTLAGGPVPYFVSDFLGFPLPGRTIWGTLRFSRPVSSRRHAW
jgi:vitamin B12 transporter